MVRLTDYKELRGNYYEELQKIDNLDECSMCISFTRGSSFFVYIGVHDEFSFDDVKCAFIQRINYDYYTYAVKWEDVENLTLFIKK